MIKKNSVVLFQGDSITDAGRTGALIPSKSLGEGFPAMIADRLASDYSGLGAKVINRGISGNRTWDLVDRWTKDCVDLQPDYLTLLIGVNDTWRGFDSGVFTTAEEYEANMRTILDRTRAETKAHIIILNPFLLDVDEKAAMHPDLVGKQEVVYKLVEEYSLTFIDLQKVFDEMVANGTSMTDISQDGVHPTPYGHGVIADEWIKTVENL